jgi:Holliday junction resolvase
MKTESEIQNEILDYLTDNGYLTTRINTIKSGWRRSYKVHNTKKSAGFPDVLAIKDNRVLLIEIKDHKGQQKQSQKDFEKVCEQTGNNYYVVRSITDVKQIINN